MKANAAFKVVSWDEKPFSEEVGGGKLTRASVKVAYTGDIEAEGLIEYLMAYDEEGSSVFYGFERVTGKIGDKSGSFVLQHNGTFENGMMVQSSNVFEGSATGDLVGLSGERLLKAGHQADYPFEFDYKLGA
jgi:hypothetical protein